MDDDPAPRVLHVAQPVDAGVPRVVAAYALAQQAAGWQVHVAAPPGGQLDGELAGTAVTVHPWQAGRSPGPSVARETRSLSAVLRRVRPDLVHLHSAKAGLAGRLAVRGRLPTVFQPHAWSFEAVSGPVRTATLAWERAALRWTDLLVCVSTAELAAGSREGLHPRAGLVAPNGVDLTAVPYAEPGARLAARTALGLPDAPTVVCVGRLARQKGQDVLLAAWPAVLAAVPGAQLVLVGDGPDAEALGRTARGLPGVHLLGAQREVARCYAAADVVALPSRWEGMSLALLEAMAVGRSVVASDVAGVREALVPGAGCLVPAADPPALAAALVARLATGADPDREGRAGRANVQAHHDVSVGAAAVTAAYAGLLR